DVNLRWSRVAMWWAVVHLTACASLGPQLPALTGDEIESEALDFSVRTLGASGAFGAGALAGSTTSGTRPEFTVVTGVSSGALVAPLAFLGPSWDEEMTRIFTTGETDGLLQSRGLGAVFGSSVYSGEPLRRLIERYADDAMISAIATEAAKGRLLLVATTDFDSGEPVIWDLGSIALHGDKNAKPLVQTLLLASASVPGMLPPVTVRFRSQGKMRSETHVDGGGTLPLFIVA